jgi:hypothetical protein
LQYRRSPRSSSIGELCLASRVATPTTLFAGTAMALTHSYQLWMRTSTRCPSVGRRCPSMSTLAG